MPSTPIYSIPYQALTDPPDGAGLGAAGFLAVETQLARIDGVDTAQNTRIGTAKTVTVYQGVQSGNGGGAQTATTSEVDALNCTVSFSTVKTNAVCVVTAVLHVQIPSVGTGLIIGRLNIDTVTTTSPDVRADGTRVGTEITVAQQFKFTLAASGAHVVKMRLIRTGSGGAFASVDGGTNFILTVYEAA